MADVKINKITFRNVQKDIYDILHKINNLNDKSKTNKKSVVYFLDNNSDTHFLSAEIAEDKITDFKVYLINNLTKKGIK